MIQFWGRSRHQRYENLDGPRKSAEETTSQLTASHHESNNARLVDKRTLLTVFGILTLFTLCAIIVAIYSPFLLREATSNAISPVSCGNSSAEAISRGCSFDQLTWSWYPPHCPHYANEEFTRAEAWTFFLDNQGEQEATGDWWRKAMDNEVRLWGQRREHLTHCVYLMLSVAQVVRDKTPAATKMLEYKHLQHCADFMLEALRQDKDWDRIDTRVPYVDYDIECF